MVAVERDLRALSATAASAAEYARQRAMAHGSWPDGGHHTASAARILERQAKLWRTQDPSELAPPFIGIGFSRGAADFDWEAADARVAESLLAIEASWLELMQRAFYLQGYPPEPSWLLEQAPATQLERSLRDRQGQPELTIELRRLLATDPVLISVRDRGDLAQPDGQDAPVTLFTSADRIPAAAFDTDAFETTRLGDLAPTWRAHRAALIDPGTPWQLAIPAARVRQLRSQ